MTLRLRTALALVVLGAVVAPGPALAVKGGLKKTELEAPVVLVASEPALALDATPGATATDAAPEETTDAVVDDAAWSDAAWSDAAWSDAAWSD